ncbi:alpha/beta hydrolase [Terriglobus albidus]|uniref:alpha/beta hydrolase n=1 Tax=Terriglobus albidus TaxID=1592106 RepID=UPI0021DFADFA|nr:alpha/beta hydrolase [Terriglobus albidus]
MRPVALLLISSLWLITTGFAQRPPEAEEGPSTPPNILKTPAGTVETGSMGNAAYRIDVPANWNHSLVVFYHGYSERSFHYRSDAQLHDQARPMFQRGFAVIQSGYSQTGWALQAAYPETERLRKYFTKKYGQPKETFVAGGSMGGALTMMTLELNPKPYVAGLDLCGAVEPTYEWASRRFAWRAAFDYYFPGIFPPLVPTPQNFTENDGLRQKILTALKANPAAAASMRDITYEHTDLQVANLMMYITWQMADFQRKAGGNPFENRNYIYTRSSEDPHTDYALNDGVRRYAADDKARKWVATWYTPTGKLTRPMLALHTVFDPLVPATPMTLYGRMVEEAGFGNNYVQTYVHREGHCTMNADEVGRAFDQLLLWVHQKKIPQAGLLR